MKMPLFNCSARPTWVLPSQTYKPFCSLLYSVNEFKLYVFYLQSVEGARLERLVHQPDLLLEGGDVVDELLHGLVPVVDVRRLQVVPVAVQNKLGSFQSMMIFIF